MSEETDNLKEVVLLLASYVDALANRAATPDEKGKITLLQEIREMLDK